MACPADGYRPFGPAGDSARRARTPAFNELIEAASRRRLSTASFVELWIVIEARRGAEGIRDLDLFLATTGIELVAFDVAQARLAREGFRCFGKGRHPAGLKSRRLLFLFTGPRAR